MLSPEPGNAGSWCLSSQPLSGQLLGTDAQGWTMCYFPVGILWIEAWESSNVPFHGCLCSSFTPTPPVHPTLFPLLLPLHTPGLSLWWPPLCALWMAGHCTAVLLSHPWHVTQEFSCFLHILVLSGVEFPSTGKKFVAQIKITPGSKSPFFLICSNQTLTNSVSSLFPTSLD